MVRIGGIGVVEADEEVVDVDALGEEQGQIVCVRVILTVIVGSACVNREVVSGM